jgi:predicted ATPase
MKYGVYHMTEISTGSLCLEAINFLMSELLSSAETKTADPASVAYKKMGGNTSFVRQFLSSLMNKKLLYFHPGMTKWVYDIDVIRTDMAVRKHQRLHG